MRILSRWPIFLQDIRICARVTCMCCNCDCWYGRYSKGFHLALHLHWECDTNSDSQCIFVHLCHTKQICPIFRWCIVLGVVPGPTKEAFSTAELYHPVKARQRSFGEEALASGLVYLLLMHCLGLYLCMISQVKNTGILFTPGRIYSREN